MKQAISLSFILSFLILTACSDDGAPADTATPMLADITVLTPLGGVGDNGYCDAALSGILECAAGAGLEVSIIRPRTLAEAAARASEWNTRHTARRRMLVLPDCGYADIARDIRADGSASTVLLFESDGRDMPAGVASFAISRYGAAWLAGSMAQGSGTTHIVGGRPDDPQVAEAAAGFADGYTQYNPAGTVMTHYLADDHTGWAMPDSLYRLAARYQDDFFFPLAKGSNSGIFKFSRETPFTFLLIAGMDVDCSTFSKRVPFSVVIDVKTAVSGFVSRWSEGEDISGHTLFGLADGSASIRLNRLFYDSKDINDVWEHYYADPSYWKNIYENNYREALGKEAAYER